jgi:dTDP-glucose 4,6-dehydratase
MTILVTGGAGFIGGHFILDWFKTSSQPIINLDNLSYASQLANLYSLENKTNYHFVQGDIANLQLIKDILKKYHITGIVHFAAQTHVDRSIDFPEVFMQTNVIGTLRLLEASRNYWHHLTDDRKTQFKFIHVSTDEVYGSLDLNAPAFTELSQYAPNNPYAASKASADHIVRSYVKTYGFPAIICNCSNNYGPFQYPEKFIPMCITQALNNEPIKIYGDGLQVRDWLYVKDHCSALRIILEKGRDGESYNIGGNNQITNIELAKKICFILDELHPKADGLSYALQIEKVSDRPGHDRRYSINSAKLQSELGWIPLQPFDLGLRKTVSWYLENTP